MRLRTVVVVTSLLVVACTTTGRIDTEMPLVGDVSRYKRLVIDVSFDPQVRGGARWRLPQMLGEKLGATGRFNEVSTSGGVSSGAGDLALKVVAREMPRGGFWDRTIFANATVRLDVELLDNVTRNVVGACVVESKATMGALWSAAGRRAVARAVEKVAEFVARD